MLLVSEMEIPTTCSYLILKCFIYFMLQVHTDFVLKISGNYFFVRIIQYFSI